MDKIREEFEKWEDNKEPYYINEACEKIHDGKDELLEVIDKISEAAFKAGHKSRDEEIKKLRDALEEVSNILYVDSDGTGDIMEARNIISEALKDGA